MDENYERGAHREEGDFAMRFIRAGNWFQFSPEASVYHLGPSVIPEGGARNWHKGRDFRYFHHCIGDWYFNLAYINLKNFYPLFRASLHGFVFNRQSLERPLRLPLALAYWFAGMPVAFFKRMRGARLIGARRNLSLR
jgi:hypothetical protein